MTITFRHPEAHHHPWQWLAAGAAAVVLSAGAYTGIRAITSSDSTSPKPTTTYVDSTGLNAIFGVRLPTSDAYVDRTGLGAVFGANVPTQNTYVDRTGLSVILGGAPASQPAYVDRSGLGAVFGVTVPTQHTYVDPTGLGQALSVEVPAG